MSDNPNGFTIAGRLPSLNDYINACRSHWSKGAALKRETEDAIFWHIISAKSKGTLRPVSGPVAVSFEWHESDQRRDWDNIISAKKYILDAMQRAGIIPNDNRKTVVGLADTLIDDTKDFVYVTIQAAEWRK